MASSKNSINGLNRAILSYMRTALSLHKTAPKAEWHYVKPQDRNTWQKLAASTKGILAPANFITLAGAFAVFAGLFQLFGKVTTGAILLIIAGRLADIADGYVADKTATKSPLGEILDVSTDKTLALAAVIVLLLNNLAPVLILTVIFLHVLINSAISIYGKIRGANLHPSLSGKLANAAVWATLGFYLSSHLLDGISATACLGVAWIAFIIFVYLASISTFYYYKQLKNGAA